MSPILSQENLIDTQIKVESSKRGNFMNPLNTLRIIGIQRGSTAADFGSGTGHFALALAELVGLRGEIYAIDIQKNLLDILQSKAKTANLNNIAAIHSNLESEKGSKLKDTSMDLVLLANILYQSPERAAIVKEAWRILKFNGRLVIIDWLPEKLLNQSRPSIAPEEAKSLAQNQGFVLLQQSNPDSFHYAMVFRK